MKRNVRRYKSGIKFIHILLILIFVAGITFLCLSLLVPSKKKDEISVSNTTVNETEKKTEQKKEEKKEEEEKENPDKTPAQYDGEKPTDSAKINASLTKNEVVDGTYYLRVTIYELINDGTCELHMESDKGDTLDRSTKIMVTGPESSTCEEGFDIPTSGISAGKYNFTIKFKSGTKTGSVNGVINI